MNPFILTVEPLSDPRPVPIRLRAALKQLLRQHALRCVHIRQASPRPPTPAAAEGIGPMQNTPRTARRARNGGKAAVGQGRIGGVQARETPATVAITVGDAPAETPQPQCRAELAANRAIPAGRRLASRLAFSTGLMAGKPGRKDER